MMKCMLMLLLFSGCGASYFSAKTELHWNPETKELKYSSSKEFEGLTADVEFYPDGRLKKFKTVVTKAGTNESAIAAASEATKDAVGLGTKLVELLATKQAVPVKIDGTPTVSKP